MKKLFSRFPLVAVTIILIFLAFVTLTVGTWLLLDRVVVYLFPWTGTLIRALEIAVVYLSVVIAVFHAANRDMIPEAKVPCVICIIVLNVVGVAMYIVFSSNRPSRKNRRKYVALKVRGVPFSNRVFDRDETESALGRWAGVSEALSAMNPSAVLFGGTKTQYFPVGEQFAESFLKDLNGAKRYIFLEYFIIEYGQLWNAVLEVLTKKAAEGVDVRLMYDDVGCMGKVGMNYHKKLKKLGIQCVKFNPFVPVVTNVHNNRDHRKIAVIDGLIAYTGGINLADEYVNLKSPFGHWKDTAVRLEGEGAKGFLLMFLRLYNLSRKDLKKGEAEDFSGYIPAEYPRFEDGYVQPYGDGPRPLYERQVGEDVYINILNTARRYVYISTPYLIIDYRLREALVLAAKRGVDVRILTPHIPDKKIPYALARSNYAALMRGGVKIYEYTPGFNHAKGFVADGEVGVVGTINLDYRSLLFHFEDAALMFYTSAVKEMERDMLETFEKSRLQTEKDAKRNVVSRGVCELAKLFAPLF